MFVTRNDLKEQLAAANADVTRLEAELLEAQTKLSESAALAQQVAELTDELGAAREAIVNEEAAHAETTRTLEQALAGSAPDAVAARVTSAISSEDEDDAPIREAVQAIVTNEVAKCGIRPLDLGANSAPAKPGEKEMTRTEFNELSPRQKSDFCLAGGRITESE